MGLYRAVRLILKYAVMYLSMLSPRSRKICVFGAWLGEKYADNAKELFEQAQKRKSILPVWIAKNQTVVKEVRKLGYRAYAFTSLKGIWYQLRAKYAVGTNGISDFNHAFLGGAVLINLWHGVPLKKVAYDDGYACAWDSRKQRLRDAVVRVPLGNEYVVATSGTMAKIYQSAFRRPAEKVLCLGQPRNDVFFRGSRKMMFPGKKIILYAPTHRKEGKTKIALEKLLDLKKLDAFCRERDYYFMVKKHFYHKGEKEELGHFERILDITAKRYDTQALLMETDILVTDYSSIYIDYMLLNRPILFFAYDYAQYLKEDRQMYFAYDEVTPGEKVRTSEELLHALGRISNGYVYDPEKRQQILDLFYCEAGRKEVGSVLLDRLEAGGFR